MRWRAARPAIARARSAIWSPTWRASRGRRLAEARALRAELGHGAGRGEGEGRPSAERLARIRLLEDRPEAALEALGGACAAGLTGDRLRALGLVHEFGDRRSAARACYELAVAAGDQPAMLRLARLDARLPDAELAEMGRSAAGRAALNRAAGQGIAAAHWALARLAAAAGDQPAALARADRALSLAGAAAGRDTAEIVEVDAAARADAGWVADARALRDGLANARRAEELARRERRRRLVAGGAALLALLAALLARLRWRGWTVAAALRRSPALFPEVGRAVAEIRHDVLKHRAGVLGVIAEPGARRDDIRRALTEPQPTSAAVAGIYDRLALAARGLGMQLRPLAREPVFGPLARDLALAETLACASEPAGAAASTDAALLAADARLRGVHADRLTELTQLGPRTRLDAAELAGWIGAVEAAARRDGAGWAAPSLMLGELAVEFPVERGALGAIFANLLRNAQAAVAGAEDPRVIVRVERERDVAGRQVANLFVGDSSPAPLTLEAIEARESGRGLAIVRDLVRQWRGHLVVRPEPAPFTKQVGACFPS